MKLLLDTHVFLWYISGASRLPARIRDNIRDPTNEVYLSVVSLWEAIIKNQIGKLPLPEPPEQYLPRQREQHLITSLAVDEARVVHLASLPQLHRDPFDRLLITLINGRRRVMGSPAGSRKDLRDTWEFAAAHGVRPRVTRMPLEAAGEALALMHDRRVRGRIVLMTE
jgi:PIN domain nuclease of toxin-antitoxin system